METTFNKIEKGTFGNEKLPIYPNAFGETACTLIRIPLGGNFYDICGFVRRTHRPYVEICLAVEDPKS
jgi:hypothetical protein